jgi:nucleotide-binding universal stress UspA family protein
MTIRKILFPVDFSPSCDAMVPIVKRSAAVFSARVTLLYVLEPSASLTYGFELRVRPLREVEEDRERVARAKLGTYLLSKFPLDESPGLLVAGEAAAGIAKVAKDLSFDLIVMPTRAGVFQRMLLGSITAKVLNDADCKVMTTQHAETILPRPLAHREWVCAARGGQPNS